MTNINLREANRKASGAKFEGKKQLVSKVVPRYPDSPERELRRVTMAYMNIVTKELRKELPPLVKAYRAELRKDARYDDRQGLRDRTRKAFQGARDSISEKLKEFDLRGRITNVGKTAKKSVLRDWKRVVKKTLGIDVLEDYYTDDFYNVRAWIEDNVSYITSIPIECLERMEKIMMDAYSQGRTANWVQNKIQKEFHLTRSQARTIARDQMGTLFAQLNEAHQRDAGVSKYKWSTVRDERVRKCHAELEGRIISWDDPPEMWYDTKSRGRVYTGRRCHPGQDYCCRCSAIPVFDWDTMNIPMRGGGEQDVHR